MANYGIQYCKRAIKRLEDIEDKLFDETGSGFDMISEQYLSLCRLKRWLERFENEKRLGCHPSYNPSIHGTDCE